MGSYLAACVFYATLFQESPVGLPFISTLNQSTATFLQNIAAITVIDSLSTWNINANLPKADFSYAINTNIVSFTNNSVKADSYYWDFGDGNSDNTENPVHTYVSPGKYVVNMTASSACADDIKTDTIEIIATGIDYNNLRNHIKLYPNPATDILHVELSGDQHEELELKILDLTGRSVFEKRYNIPDSDREIELNTKLFTPGIYLLRIRSNNFSITHRIVVQ
jgi:hypothetical protein